MAESLKGVVHRLEVGNLSRSSCQGERVVQGGRLEAENSKALGALKRKGKYDSHSPFQENRDDHLLSACECTEVFSKMCS